MKYLIIVVYLVLLLAGYILIKIINTSISGFDFSFYIVYFFAISYLFFYKNFMKELGEETAKVMLAEELTTIKETIETSFIEERTKIKETVETSFAEEKTRITETVKNEFATALEKFKSNLQKETIAYQVDYSVFYTERTKAIIDLNSKLADVHSAGSNLAEIWREFQDNEIELQIYTIMCQRGIKRYHEALHEAYDAIDHCNLYLEKSLFIRTQNLLNKVAEYSNSFIKSKTPYSNDELYNNKRKLSELVSELYELSKTFREIIQPKMK